MKKIMNEVEKYKLAFKNAFELAMNERQQKRNLQIELTQAHNRLKSLWTFQKKKFIELEHRQSDLQHEAEKYIESLDFGVDENFVKRLHNTDFLVIGNTKRLLKKGLKKDDLRNIINKENIS